jgi:hypothetical protein
MKFLSVSIGEMSCIMMHTGTPSRTAFNLCYSHMDWQRAPSLLDKSREVSLCFLPTRLTDLLPLV